MLAAPTTIDRTSLPRSLIGRRRRFFNPAYQFDFEIGQTVFLVCTGEEAIVSGRMQVMGCEDEYAVEVIGAKCAPLRVFAQEITADVSRTL
ncbi:hypothetical protein HJC04_26340 [Rhizobium sp. NLR8a]|uniref:hypothetical protein n=1 Tax=Rhizobium sp. NLR8a TaxID=2731119 RepID=UPI001C82897A|nr:hypothetical protein [Rhizobium sp. NLR8a]MBX5223799.1 hypothetical protein [Rhizobium sp. NLR8a]